MATIACPNCDRQINRAATRCKYCGWAPGQPTIGDSTEPPASATVASPGLVAATAPPRRRSNTGIIIGGAIAVVVLACIGISMSSQSRGGATPTVAASLATVPPATTSGVVAQVAGPTSAPVTTATLPPPSATAVPPTVTAVPATATPDATAALFATRLAASSPVVTLTPAPAGSGPLTAAERQYIGMLRQQATISAGHLGTLGRLLQNFQNTETYGRQLRTVLVQLREVDAAGMRMRPPTPRMEVIHQEWRAITTEVSLATYDIENAIKAAAAGDSRAIGILADGRQRMARVTPLMEALTEHVNALEAP